jgi:hypothetical protein
MVGSDDSSAKDSELDLRAVAWARWSSWGVLLFFVLTPLVMTMAGASLLVLVGATPLVLGWWLLGPGRLLATDVHLSGNAATIRRLAAPRVVVQLGPGSSLKSDPRSRKIVWLADHNGHGVRLHTGVMNVEPLISYCRLIDGVQIAVSHSSIHPPLL